MLKIEQLDQVYVITRDALIVSDVFMTEREAEEMKRDFDLTQQLEVDLHEHVGQWAKQRAGELGISRSQVFGYVRGFAVADWGFQDD